MRKTKYGSKKTIVDNIEFDSKDEARYYVYLKKEVQEGRILKFELQPKYVLIPKFEKLGVKHRQATYSPDFKIFKADGTVELIDVKGFSTQQGDLRRKLFDSLYQEKLIWVCRNLKYGNKDGWIEYEELKKKRAKRKKEEQYE